MVLLGLVGVFSAGYTGLKSSDEIFYSGTAVTGTRLWPVSGVEPSRKEIISVGMAQQWWK